MTTQDMDILARKIVSLEKRHNSLARAQQLPNSSVRLVDGDDVGLADSAEATKDIGDEAAYLGDWLTDADNNLDDNAEYGVEVPEWIQDAGHAGDVAWDSTQFATDLALTLDTELTQAQQELEQAQIDLTQALADSATALQEAQEALQEAEDAVTAANSATAAASAAEATAQAAQTAAGSAQDAADQAAQDALAATNTANTAQNTADAAQTTANAKGKVIIQSAAPDASDRLPQNLWIDTTGGANTPKRWSGSVWVAVTDKAATDAAAAAVSAQNRADDAYDEAVAAATVAGNAQAAANGKNRVWYQATAPTGTGHNVGDTWFNTGDSNKISRWNGSAWTATLFGTNAIDNLAITNALIADATIQNAKIANLDAAKITTGYLAAARIQAGTIVADKLASGAVVADKIASNAVTAVKINANAVTAPKIAAGAVIAEKIAADAVTADKIVANAISGDKLQANAIDGMTITGALVRGGVIEQTGASVEAGTYSHPLHENDAIFQQEGVTSEPNRVTAHTSTRTAVGTIVGNRTTTEIFWNIPAEYIGARIQVSMMVRRATAGDVWVGNPSTANPPTRVNANTWTRVSSSAFDYTSAGSIVSTMTGEPLRITEPQVTVVSAGTTTVRLANTGNGPSLSFLTGGVTRGSISASGIALRQSDASGYTAQANLSPVGLAFQLRNNQGAPVNTYQNTITADGGLGVYLGGVFDLDAGRGITARSKGIVSIKSDEQLQLHSAGDIWFMSDKVNFKGDTEWANVSIPGGAGVCRWKRQAGIIYLQFDITYNSALGAGAVLAPGFTLPSAARPAGNTPIIVMGAGTHPATGYVEASSGNSAIRNSSAGSFARFMGSGQWPAI